MNAVFYIAALVAIVSTFMVVRGYNAVHSLLYLVVSLLAVSLMFLAVGAWFIAALEVIVYASAIMVLFIFVIMMLNQGQPSEDQERQWLNGRLWFGPGFMALILLIESVYVLWGGAPGRVAGEVFDTRALSMALFGPYLLVVELSSMLLLAGLVGAYALARRDPAQKEKYRR
jgi:NADH-quinone oxidoreductase subunit J